MFYEVIDPEEYSHHIKQLTPDNSPIVTFKT